MKLQLRSGRSISLDSIIQYRTYAGLLAGRPYRQRNDEIIRETLDRASFTPGRAASATPSDSFRIPSTLVTSRAARPHTLLKETVRWTTGCRLG